MLRAFYIASLLLCYTIVGEGSSGINPLSNMNGMSNRQQSTDEIDTQRVYKSGDSKQQEREQLYEAYNLLHTLAQVEIIV
jgi:hypothetical protein